MSSELSSSGKPLAGLSFTMYMSAWSGFENSYQQPQSSCQDSILVKDAISGPSCGSSDKRSSSGKESHKLPPASVSSSCFIGIYPDPDANKMESKSCSNLVRCTSADSWFSVRLFSPEFQPPLGADVSSPTHDLWSWCIFISRTQESPSPSTFALLAVFSEWFINVGEKLPAFVYSDNRRM